MPNAQTEFIEGSRVSTWSAASRILKQVLNQTVSLDLLFQALAVPARRMMVERLSRGPASVTQLAKPLPMSLPAVVQHLQVLESSGLIRSEKTGRVRTCRIEPAALKTAMLIGQFSLLFQLHVGLIAAAAP